MEGLYNIFTEVGVPMTLYRLIKMCLNETEGKVCVGTRDPFPNQNSLKGDVLLPLPFYFTLKCGITRVQQSQVGLKLNGSWWSEMMMNIYWDIFIDAIKRHRNSK
jgi:hypothetical protein